MGKEFQMTDTRKDFEEWKVERDIQTNNSPIMPFEIWQSCQSLNDKRIQHLLAVIAKKDESLRKIARDAQSRAHAEQIADEAIAIKPQDVELVEVDPADYDAMSLISDGTKLYTIKTKE
jgi:hypothetical protein